MSEQQTPVPPGLVGETVEVNVQFDETKPALAAQAKPVKRRAGQAKSKKVKTAKKPAAKSLTDMMSDEGSGEAELCRVPTADILTDVPEFIFSDLSLTRMFEARELAGKLKKRYPFWVDEVAMVVAVMGLAHKEPSLPCVPALFYAKLADSNKVDEKSLFAVLFNDIRKAFPHLLNFGGEVEDTKNG